ncbi:MAG: twin-arginine translocase TatA/TatE family subunit [Candidatus Heimdallarchaeota archaeon]|nr:twin-arginine translocase TatA/TatE family subunit [Candidatus Heimdallarchaeota archaeon]
MGFGGISIWQLLIVLVIIILLFGTKKLRSLGGDLGSAIKSFKQSVREGDEVTDDADSEGSIGHTNETTQAKTTEKDKSSS